MPVPTCLLASILISSCAMLLFVSSVVQWSIVSEIVYVVVLVVSIVMAHFHPIRARTYERFGHRHGYQNGSSLAVFVQFSALVPRSVSVKGFGGSFIGPYAPEFPCVTHLVESFVSWYVTPFDFHTHYHSRQAHAGSNLPSKPVANFWAVIRSGVNTCFRVAWYKRPRV